MSKLSPKTLKLIAVIISVVLAGLVYSYLSSLQSEKREVSSEEVQNSVVVAAVDIPKNALVTKEMVKLVSIPEGAVQKEACRNLDDVVGTTAKEAIYAGEQINKRRLFEDEKMAGFIGLIPEDKRAVSVPITDVTGVAGFAKPGNYVDVMLVTDKGSDKTLRGKLLLQNMLLLAVNKKETDENKEAIKEQMATATLAATPDEAVRLAVAQKQGEIYLTLRPLHPKNRLAVANEIVIYQGNGNNAAKSAAAPARPAVKPQPPSYSMNQPKVSERPRLSVGEKINVIRGNKVESVTTR